MPEVDLNSILHPSKLARQRKILEGKYLLKEMGRLADSGVVSCGPVVYRFAFDTNEFEHQIISASVSTVAVLMCQRCMQPFEQPIESVSQLAILGTNDEVPAGFEPLIVEDDTVLLSTLLEEELILSLPLVAKHKDSCETILQESLEENTETSVKVNPFAVLGAMLNPNSGKNNE